MVTLRSREGDGRISRRNRHEEEERGKLQSASLKEVVDESGRCKLTEDSARCGPRRTMNIRQFDEERWACTSE